MTGLTFIPVVGRADHCTVSAAHRQPAVLRWVWHHVQPVVCGGPTVASNLSSLCDSCHYAVHVLLWMLKQYGGDPASIAGMGLPRQRRLAIAGWDACVTAGTTALIPKEAAE